MNSVVLDTHAYLWFVFDDPRLSPAAAAVIEDGSVSKLLSIVSLWEIVIKCQLEKLRLGMPVDALFEQHVTGRNLEVIDVELRHLLAYSDLPLAHRDPFDRLIIAQASVLQVPVLTADSAFSLYDVEVLW